MGKKWLEVVNKNMFNIKIGAGIAAMTAGAILAGYAQEEKSALPAAWKPNPKMLRYIGRQTRVLSYAVQAPIGYTARQTRQPRLIAYTWLGQARKTGVTPNLTLALAPTPIVNKKPMTPEQLLTNALNAMKRGHEDWTQTPAERGQINGLTFARAYWTGTERQRSRKLRGVAYMGVDGSVAISMQCQDLALPGAKPGAEGAQNPADAAPPDANAQENGDVSQDNFDHLKLAEAAMQTFRRYTTPKPADPAAPVTQ